MSDISNYYKMLIQDLENKLESKKDFEYVKNSIDKLMDFVKENIENRVVALEEKQNLVEEKIDKFDEKMNKFNDEFLFDDEMIDDDLFEISCPYCNYVFETDLTELKNEINCPDCNNIIELDWGTESGCGSNGCSCCSGCGGQKEDFSESDEEDDDM